MNEPFTALRTMTTDELAERARKYVDSPQFAVDLKALEERAAELAKDIQAMRKIAMATWREPMTI